MRERVLQFVAAYAGVLALSFVFTPAGAAQTAAGPVVTSDAETPADAQDTAAGANGIEEIFARCIALIEDVRRAEALQCFETARSIEEHPVIVYNIATTLAALGRSVEAMEEVERFLEIAGDHPEQRAAALRLRETLRETVRPITLRITPVTATLEVDGAIRPEQGRTRTFDLDPGDHILTVRQEGYVTENIDVRGRAEIEVNLTAEPGTLVVRTGIPNSTIFVDGEEVGRGESRVEVQPGNHEIKVVASGQADFERSVEVGPGADMTIDATFTRVERPLRRNPILWTVVGVVVVGAVVGTTLALTLERDINQGNSGVTVQALTF